MTIRIGIVGHVDYEGLDPILEFLAREAPGMGYSLAYEAELEKLAPGGARLGHPSQIDALITLGFEPDTAKWVLQSDGTWLRRTHDAEGEPLRDIQETLIEVRRTRGRLA